MGVDKRRGDARNVCVSNSVQTSVCGDMEVLSNRQNAGSGNTMSDGIETTRKVYRIDDVPEYKISNYRLRGLQERDTSGIRESELLEIAEQRLFEAVRNYLRRGANEGLVARVVDTALKWEE